MASLDQYLDDQLARGRGYFSREEALTAVGLAPANLAAAVTRLIKKRRLANPRHGFYLSLRPEDWAAGAPDPIRWIDPLMKYQGIDYRISLLRAAAYHGSSHQAAMVFQVIVPKQFRAFEIGRHRLQFIYQAPAAFAKANVPKWVTQIKSQAGFAKVASVSGVAQIAKDLGAGANPRKLAEVAAFYENSSVRRLGYLLDLSGHKRQAKALEVFVGKAKSAKPLDPSVKSLSESLTASQEKNSKWKLVINSPVEIDA
jgi:predicted transcriptional regulator of viral defense system